MATTSDRTNKVYEYGVAHSPAYANCSFITSAVALSSHWWIAQLVYANYVMISSLHERLSLYGKNANSIAQIDSGILGMSLRCVKPKRILDKNQASMMKHAALICWGSVAWCRRSTGSTILGKRAHISITAKVNGSEVLELRPLNFHAHVIMLVKIKFWLAWGCHVWFIIHLYCILNIATWPLLRGRGAMLTESPVKVSFGV